DDNVAFEAFKAGAFDLRLENDAKNWATRYIGKNFDNHYIIKEGQNPLAITAGRKEKFKRQRLTGDAIDPLLSVDHPSGLRQQG
ncbi:hypothetical protein KU617_23005, partial [Salmonella enterica subsp. enterica serovar Montevideo]|nr:hypothetical protein [Salmonella enterica subsp. enterica serovar Montevideo]